MATAAQLQRLMRRMEPRLQRAFMESIEAIRSRAGVSALEAAIASNDLEAAIRAAGIRDSSFTALSEAVRSSYAEAGGAIVAMDVPNRFGLEFNMSNPRAQRWIEQHSSGLVVEITQSQREAIRTTISAGFQQGRNPRSVALDVVGRINRQTGRRTGGVIGLHQDYANAVVNARDDLQNLNSRYFNRELRNRRFDGMVRRAIEEGRPLTQESINRITTDYEARLTRQRGEMISRTEALSSTNAAGSEAMDQVIDEGLAKRDAIQETWDSSGDSRTRATHQAANGQTITHGEAFIVGGYAMRYPGDTSMGAPASEVIACRCVVRRSVDFSRTRL